MATKYVAKDGNDSNGGTSYADAKLTIAGAISAASSGDTISIGPGVYNEAVTPGAKNLTFQADGYVVLDGGGTLTHGFNMTSSASTSVVNDLIVQNFTSQAFAINRSANVAQSLTLNRCVARYCLWGAQLATLNDATGGSLTANNCIFHHLTYGVLQMGASTGSTLTVSRCTIADCSNTGAYKGGAGNFIVKHCVLSNNTKHYQVDSTTQTITVNFNCVYFDGTATSTWSGTTTTVFATWKSTSGKDALSVSQNPVFVDRAKELYGLHFTSSIPSILQADDGSGYGAGHSALPYIGWSDNDPDGNWDGVHLVNLVVNGSGNLALASGSASGTAYFEPYDLSRVQNLQRANIKTSLNTNHYPSDVPDFDPADTQPKRMTFRFRHDTDPFDWDDDEVDGPVWIEVEPSGLGQNVNVNCQYFQIAVTLRSDGV